MASDQFDFNDLTRWGEDAYRLTGYPTSGGSENLGFGNPLVGFGLSLPKTPRKENPGAWVSGNAPLTWANYLSDALYRAALGTSPTEMAASLGSARAQNGPWQFPQSNIMAVYGQKGNFDKALHAYASYLAQQRYGTLPAHAMSVGKEGLDLIIGQASKDDLAANLLGILLGQQKSR